MANLTQIVYLTKADYEALLADTHDPKQYTKNGKTIYYDENALYITPETVTMEELSGILPVSKGGTGASSFTSGQLLVGNGTNAISTKAISGSIINDANTIPTTQAVYNYDPYTVNTSYLTKSNRAFSVSAANVSNMINLLSEGSNDLTANDFIITQYVGGGTSNKTYYRRAASKVINATLVKTALGTDSSTTNQWLNKSGNWSTPTAANVGAVAKLSSSTDNAIVRFDGTSGAIQNSGITIDDNNQLVAPHTTNKSDGLRINYSSTIDFFMGVGTGNVNHGIYDSKKSTWILLGDANNNWTFDGNVTGSASTAGEFTANKTVELTGDVIGSASSKGGWTIATTIGEGKVTNAMLAGSIANGKLANSSIKIGNKTISLGETATLADIGISYPVTSVAGKTGAVTLAKGDVGLGSVDNTADADKTVKYANMLTGFTSRASNFTWGNQTGTAITVMNDSTGGSVGFRRDNPASGQMSMSIDGTIYIKEGGQNIAEAVKGFSVSGQTVTYTTLWGSTSTFTTQDTKNTAGSTNSTSKLYLIGATSQAANPTTNSYQYTYTNNGLLSALKLGLNLNGTEKAHLEWNDTDQSIDFIFA